MLDKNTFKLSAAEKEQRDLKFSRLKKRYKNYKDPWGFNIETVKNVLILLLPFYKKYFRVRVFGIENIKDEPYMVVSNHTGQVPIDGALITMAMAYEVEKPRVLHAMIERFMVGLPFIGDITCQTGSVLGDRENCKWLLKNGESILVFPEGVRGINKNTFHFYELQKFSNGFFRIAMQTKTKILPVTVIGAEEMFPFVVHAKRLAKKLGLPNLPISANIFPLPSPIDIYFGEPIEVPEGIESEATDADIRKYVYNVEKQIKKNIKTGLKNRREFFNWIRFPLKNFIKDKKYD